MSIAWGQIAGGAIAGGITGAVSGIVGGFLAFWLKRIDRKDRASENLAEKLEPLQSMIADSLSILKLSNASGRLSMVAIVNSKQKLLAESSRICPHLKPEQALALQRKLGQYTETGNSNKDPKEVIAQGQSLLNWLAKIR